MRMNIYVPTLQLWIGLFLPHYQYLQWYISPSASARTRFTVASQGYITCGVDGKCGGKDAIVSGVPADQSCLSEVSTWGEGGG
jgi:hypothetical protein